MVKRVRPAMVLAIIGTSGCSWVLDLLDPGPAPPSELRCGDEPPNGRVCYVPIPSGSFLMGAQASDPAAPGYDPDAAPHEGPPRQVTVDAFWMLRVEAPVNLLNACVEAGTCTADLAAVGRLFTAGGPWDKPLTGVSWSAAATLCETAGGGRLPTEIEWEWAARGPEGRRYPWGDVYACPLRPAPEDGSCGGEPQNPWSMPVEGPFGTVAQAGNVWEWVDDRYRGAEQELRVQRGGGWLDGDPLAWRTTSRTAAPPDEQLPDVGFRCVVGRGLPR